MPKHGENIWKRKDGRWEARYIKGRNPSGKALYASVYAKTYTEVKRKREIAIMQLQEASAVIYPSKSIGYIISEYLNIHKSNIKYSTYARYIEIADSHLIPDLGKMDISDFSCETGRQYVSKLLDSGCRDGTGLSSKTVKDIISVLKLVLKYAEEKKYISSAPVDFSVPKQSHAPIQVLSPNQIERLESFIFSSVDSYKLGIYLCLYTGMRIGEVCALQWKDIDCLNNTISINKTILRVRNVSDSASSKTRIIINPPKTPSSERIIPLTESLSEKLMKMKDESLSEVSYVLTGTQKYIEPRNYYAKYKRYMKKCDLDNFDFHALRHTFATRCINAGIDPKVLSEILGHASVQITLDRYVHPSLETKRNCLERLFCKQ